MSQRRNLVRDPRNIIVTVAGDRVQMCYAFKWSQETNELSRTLLLPVAVKWMSYNVTSDGMKMRCELKSFLKDCL